MIVSVRDHFDTLERILLLVLELLVDLLEHLVLDLAGEAVLFGGLRDGAGGQVQVNLIDYLTQLALHMRHNDRLRQLLPVRLIPPIVLDLDVKVERAFAAIDLLAVLVRANILSVNLFSSPAIIED